MVAILLLLLLLPITTATTATSIRSVTTGVVADATPPAHKRRGVAKSVPKPKNFNGLGNSENVIANECITAEDGTVPLPV